VVEDVGVDEDRVGMKLVEHLVGIGVEELVVEMEVRSYLAGERGVGLGDADELDVGVFGERAEEAAGVVVDEADDDDADGRRIDSIKLSAFALLIAVAAPLVAQEAAKPKPEDTEVWEPVPKVVTPGATSGAPPRTRLCSSTARMKTSGFRPRTSRRRSGRFRRHPDGEQGRQRQYRDQEERSRITSCMRSGRFRRTSPAAGRRAGTAACFLPPRAGDAGYELQVLDAYNNKTYVNGMAGSMYKQAIPLANPARKPGEWQTYDVIWTAPRSMKTAR
jgi:hypothetical protein